jgi:hypothetical protein
MNVSRMVRTAVLLSFAALAAAKAQEEVPCTECEGGGEEGLLCGWGEPTTYGSWLSDMRETEICYTRAVYMKRTCVNQQGTVVSSSTQFHHWSAVWCVPY